MLGIAAEPPRPSAPRLAPPIVAAPSVASGPASKIPVLAPTLAPVAPSRRSRTPVLVGVVAGAVLLGGAGWLLLRPGPESAAPAGSPDAADAAVGSPAASEAAASKRSLKPPPESDPQKKAADESKGDDGGRARPVRKLARRLGL